MKGLLTTCILIGVIVIITVILMDKLSPAGTELMQATAKAEQIIP